MVMLWCCFSRLLESQLLSSGMTIIGTVSVAAVQVATWIKRQIALKPAINRMRKERAAERPLMTNQVSDMY